MKEFLNFINGEYVRGTSGKTFDDINPVDGSVIGRIHEAGQGEVDAAVAAARAALQGDWGRLAVVERCKLLDAVAGEINRRFDDFLQTEIADTGKPHHLASHVDIPRGAANFQIFIDTIKSTATESFNMRTPDGKTALSYGVRPVSLEMGGKNAAVVFADCDFQVAVDTLTRSCFENAGQVCLGTERVYVERPIFEKLVAALKDRAEAMKPGLPFDKDTKIGPLISKKHQDKVLGLYQKARDEGATIVTGGGIPDMPEALRGGSWVQPTIWTGLPETATVVTEEIFGPCCHVSPFDTEEEVLAKVNANRYGLATAVFTQDIARANRLAHRIEVGLCWINAWFLRDLRTPFGGSKQSGIGREGGVHSLEFYTELRNVMVKF